MGWHSFTKSIGHGIKNAFDKLDPISGDYGIAGVTGKLGDYAKDFKDWYDGTAAMRHSAELQDQYNMKYWQMQNEYNTPSAQMQRFIAAGLNPNLAYSLSNTAGDVGRVNVGTAESGSSQIGKVISAISAWQGIKNMRLQNDNLAYQGDYVKTQNALAAAQKDRYIWDTEWLKKHNLSSFSPQFERQISSGVGLASRYNPFNIPARALGRLVGYLNSGISYRDDRDTGWNKTAFNYWRNPL